MDDADKMLGKLVQHLFENVQSLRVENGVLQMMLLERGLSKQVIRKRIRGYLKERRIQEHDFQILTKACEDILKHLASLDSEELLAKLPIPKGKLN